MKKSSLTPKSKKINPRNIFFILSLANELKAYASDAVADMRICEAEAGITRTYQEEEDLVVDVMGDNISCAIDSHLPPYIKNDPDVYKELCDQVYRFARYGNF